MYTIINITYNTNNGKKQTNKKGTSNMTSIFNKKIEEEESTFKPLEEGLYPAYIVRSY